MNVKTYLHNCNAGDLVGALAGIREIYRKYGKKAVIYQQLDIPGHYLPGLVHSVKDEKGVQVTMNRKMFDMLRPLLLSLDYIEDFRVYYGDEKIDVDLTIIRESIVVEEGQKHAHIISAKQFVNIPNMALPGWTMLAYPNMACDLSEPWIVLPEEDIEDPVSDCILVNRTERYKAPKMDYSFLKPYEKELLFVGTEQEHYKFLKEFKLEFPRLEAENFLELARALQACRFFIGNQSFPWNLANAMGTPRILEMYAMAPNCQPFVGKDNYGALFTVPLQFFFEELYKQKAVAGQRL
jgi:hypothetical protein